MTMPLLLILSATALTLIAGSFCAQAAVTTTPVTESNPAVLACQAARSANEGVLRKRPKAVQNEGTTSVFISCGLHGSGVGGITPRTTSAFVAVVNVGTAPVTVSCTAVDLSQDFTLTKTGIVPVGGSRYLQFYATELDPAGNWYTPAFSCVLPPGAGVREIWHNFNQEVGARPAAFGLTKAP